MHGKISASLISLETVVGSTLEVNWNVADFDALIDAGDAVMVRAVASNALQLTDPNPMVGAINLDADVCPLDPEVVAITVDPPTATNPDSGGPQGTLTLHAYTLSRTSTPIDSVRLAAEGPQDADWTIEASDAVLIDGQEVADSLTDPVVDIYTDRPYLQWSVDVDTRTLKDTITASSPAARDASKDTNQYVVQGYVNTNETEIPPIPGVEARFSVDNVDDVQDRIRRPERPERDTTPPIGPTRVSVTKVDATDSVLEDHGGGSYTVGGLVDKYDATVSSPVVTFTIKPTAARSTYSSVRLLTDAKGLAIRTPTETGGRGVFTVAVDIGPLAEGTYMFHALARDTSGNQQVDRSSTDGSKISVTVKYSYRPAPEILGDNHRSRSTN